MSVLNDVLERYSSPDEPRSIGYYPLSVKLMTEQQAMVQSLISTGVVSNKTDAIRLLVEAGFKYLLASLPDPVDYEIEERHREIFEELCEFELEEHR